MKRILSVFLMCSVLLLHLLLPIAATEIEVSEVLADLCTMTFDGKAFDTADYPKNSKDTDVHLLALSEQGYSEDGDRTNYALYLYFYNPSGQAFVFDSIKNKVQMGISWDSKNETIKSEKFCLEFVDASDDIGFQNVYLKYRVVDQISKYDGKTMAERQSTTRKYNVSSVELLRKGQINATDYALGDRYIIKGFDKGYGSGNESTKVVTADRKQVLEIEVNHTYWRSESSSMGVNYKQQLNAVYFAIPNEVLKNYGMLEAIAAEWYQYETTPIIVTDDRTLYDALLPYRGVEIKPVDEAVGYYFYYGGSGANHRFYQFAYNIRKKGAFRPSQSSVQIKNDFRNLGWLMMSNGRITLASKDNIDSATMTNYLNQYVNQYPLLEDYDPNNMDSHYVSRVITFDDRFEFKNYKTNHSWISTMMDYNIFNGGWSLFGGYTVDINEKYPDMLPIEVVDRYIHLSTNEIMERYCIHTEKDAKAFQKYVNEAVANDESVIMLRYLQSDYHSEALNVEELGSAPEITGSAYVAWQTVVLDFDVIELYCTSGTIPVSCGPTDFVGGTDAPSTALFGLIPRTDKSYFWAVVAVILAVVLVVYFIRCFAGDSGGYSDGTYQRRYRSNRRR